MRVKKTDRGYVDMEHVLAVGEPYEFQHGMWGFDVTLAFLDRPKQMLYYPEQLEVGDLNEPFRSIPTKQRILEAMTKKRDEFVALWKEGVSA